MADQEQQEPDDNQAPPTAVPPSAPEPPADMPTVVRPPEGPPIEDITMVRPPEPSEPPAAAEPPPSYSPPPAGPSAPPPPTGGAPYQPPPVTQGYQPYGAPPPVPGGFALPGARIPGQIDPETGLVYSDKERLTAGLIQLIPSLFGIPGIGRLYTGYTAIGLVQLIGAVAGIVLTCILIGLLLWIPMMIWGIVDGILMLVNKQGTDAQGRLLR